MAKRTIKAGSTDQTIDVFVLDSSSTTGAGLTGLAYNTAGLTCYYRKGATGTPTALTLATQTVGGAHSDGGFVAVDGTNCPGQYRLDLSDTIVATAGMVTLYLKGATNMAPVTVELEVVAYDPFDAVRLGLTALPNAAADAAGGLVISDAGGFDIDNRAPASAAVTNMNTVFNTDFAANYNTTADKWKVDVTHSAGVQVYASDFTVSSATASTVTLPTTDSAGTAIPDDDRYVYGVLRVVAGTGIGQVVLLTTAAASARQYNILSGTCPVQLDNTSQCVVEGVWQSNVSAISSDTTAADNLEAILDGTGGTGLTLSTFSTSSNMSVGGNLIVSSALSISGNLTCNNFAPTTFIPTTNGCPWNAAWDAEVQSEVQDAIEVNNLDHLVKSAVDTNFATTVHLDSVIGHLADAGGTATFDRTTDALEVLGAGVNVSAISGDTTAADNLEAYTDGTTYMPVDAHKQNWTVVDADTISVKGTDGTTEAYTKTVTTSGTADPITGSTLD